MTLDVLYEDNHCLAVAKPAGLLVQGDRTGDRALVDLAKSYVRERYDKPGEVYLGAVHRLDRPVSGVVLLARTSKAAARLSAQFRDERVRKVYHAVVESVPVREADELEHFLRKDPRTNHTAVAQADEEGARLARLRYRVVRRLGSGALLEVHPRTGRSHQIRVQLAAVGAVIVGDVRYGSGRPLGHWIALHASELEFEHPTRRERVTLRAAHPEEWEREFGMTDATM